MDAPKVLFVILGILILGIVIAIGLSLFETGVFERAYKRGQVDALTGRIQYRLETNPDSTKTWQKIEGFKLPVWEDDRRTP